MNSDFVNAIVSLLKENQLTRKEADHLAIKHGIIDKTVKKELIELAIVRVARSIALENNSFEIRFSKIVELYKNQINLSHRTSQSIIFQQYSTPAPIGFLAGEYVRHGQNEDYQIFEPSAGNGLLTISFPERNCWVNEIDNLRNANLNTQDFIQVLKVDATSELAKELHFEKKFDGITTNPPFGTYPETIDFSGFPIKHLDHLMAIRALECMKTEGRAAIIIGGHTNYDAAGRIQSGKNRIFLSYLYKHYHVDDVINIDGSLYSKQGTSFDVRLILISGRKLIPEGFPPLFSDAANPVTDFESLFERVKALMQIKHIPLNNRFRIAQAKAKSLMLIQAQGLDGYTQTNVLSVENLYKHGVVEKELSALYKTFFGKIVLNHDKNISIVFKAIGLKKSIFGRKDKVGKVIRLDSIIATAIHYLPHLIEYGKFESFGEANKPNHKKVRGVKFWNFRAKLKIDGQLYNFIIPVLETENKDKFQYSIEYALIKKSLAGLKAKIN